MKKAELLSTIGTGIVLAVLAGFLLLQIKTNVSLRKELVKVTDEVAKAKTASRQLERLEEEIRATEREAEAIYKRVPEYEEFPLGLIKGLLPVVTDVGLRAVKYDVTQSQQKKEIPSSSGTTPVIADQEEVDLEQMSMKKSDFVMQCMATSLQAMRFLDAVASFQRIAAVEEITIERDEKILPYQRVSFKLIAFSFRKQ